MNNFLEMLLVLVVTVVVPLAILLGIWADILPQFLQVVIGIVGVVLACIVVLGGGIWMLYSDITSGRYSKKV